jgi:hypothetical protein
MGERRRRRCPLCGGTGVFCGKCYRCSGRGYVLAECHTVLTMDGETTSTGDAACLPGDDEYTMLKAALESTPSHFDFFNAVAGVSCFCPAPTPRAP